MSVLRLVPLHCGTRAPLLGPLGEQLHKAFGLPVQHTHARVRLRGRVRSVPRPVQLPRSCSPSCSRTRRPTCPACSGSPASICSFPVLTYVFGEAQLGGRAAVVSLHRLDDELYGLPPNPKRLFQRLVKEAVHELGHTFDLVHCHEDGCVMASSTYVEEIDLKSERFCASCRASVR